MDEAEELFDTEFDPLPEPHIPKLILSSGARPRCEAWQIDLDAEPDDGNVSKPKSSLPPPDERAQAFTLWLKAEDFQVHTKSARKLIEQILDENPHTTLQVILEPGKAASITASLLADFKWVCYSRTTYLDRFYSILPGAMKGSKCLVVLLEPCEEALLDPETIAAIDEFATIVWKEETVPLPLVTSHNE